jgi:deazaflavin-dependent oxidoreductase (nitroreductase family)
MAMAEYLARASPSISPAKLKIPVNNLDSKPFTTPPVKLFTTLYGLGLGPLVGRLILLLTTTGRKTGMPRVTALQYEELNGNVLLGSSRGLKADWVRNILAQPRVVVQVKNRKFTGKAEVVSDPALVADFLELRLRNHPRMVGMIMRSEGMPVKPSRTELEGYAKNLALVMIKPGS